MQLGVPRSWCTVHEHQASGPPIATMHHRPTRRHHFDAQPVATRPLWRRLPPPKSRRLATESTSGRIQARTMALGTGGRRCRRRGSTSSESASILGTHTHSPTSCSRCSLLAARSSSASPAAHPNALQPPKTLHSLPQSMSLSLSVCPSVCVSLSLLVSLPLSLCRALLAIAYQQRGIQRKRKK